MTGSIVLGARYEGAPDGELGITVAKTIRMLASDERLASASEKDITAALAQFRSVPSLPTQEVQSSAQSQSVPNERGPSDRNR